jgi:hypothetical protein
MVSCVGRRCPPSGARRPPDPLKLLSADALARRHPKGTRPLALPAEGASPPGPPERDLGGRSVLVILPPLHKTCIGCLGMMYCVATLMALIEAGEA